MESEDKVDQLLKTLRDIEPLDDVPSDVSLRFQATLADLAMRDSHLKSKKNWAPSVNRFAFAASFVLVFALGAALTLNPGRESGDTIGVSQKSVKVPPMQNNVKDDQLLYSAEEGSTPETTDIAIKLSNSGHNYLVIPSGFQRTLGVGKTWNSTKALSPKILDCLKSQELDRFTNLIDAGFLNGKMVKAIWTPIGPSSWNIYLIDAGCNVLERKYLKSD